MINGLQIVPVCRWLILRVAQAHALSHFIDAVVAGLFPRVRD